MDDSKDTDVYIETGNGAYEPSDDSYLMAEAVKRFAFGKVLDMGCGTGIQGITAAKKGCKVTFVDINPDAIECAKLNAKQNRAQGEFVVSDLFSKVKGRFNTIIFNPPYLPDDGALQTKADTATYGGKDGRKIIDRFLKEYKTHIEKEHVVLLLESSLNDYEKDVERLNAEIVGKTHLHFEELVVLRFG